MPQDDGDEIIAAPLATDPYGYAGAYNREKFAIDATMIAADLGAAAGFDAPSAYQHLDSFATASSGRGMGFREPPLMALAPRYANVATRNLATRNGVG